MSSDNKRYPMPEMQVHARQQKLLDELDRLGLDVLILNAGPSLTYLTGLHFHLSERPVVAAFRRDGPPVIVLPALEEAKLDGLPFEVRAYTYGEDPVSRQKALRRAVVEARLDYRRVGLEPRRFRVLELRLIEEAAPRAAYLDGEAAIASLRARKDASEIERLREAVRVAEKAVRTTLAGLRTGITEKELASSLTARLLEGGSAPELPFSPIVAFAESTADPHAVSSDRSLREGDLILVDWGATVDGYASDMTRMFSYGPTDAETSDVVAVVAAANEAARQAAGPGVSAREVDRAARSVIEKAGFGPQFTHRTGHGLGLDVHEMPYISSASETVLQPGMTFTIEPGIYSRGRAGARIEDVIVVTDDGVDTLTSLERGVVDLARAGSPV